MRRLALRGPLPLRWARLSELSATDRADALALAPDLLDLERLASAEAAAREAAGPRSSRPTLPLDAGGPPA